MSNNCKIEWVAGLAQSLGFDARSWNPTIGCSRASEGCRNCYAAAIAYRFGGGGNGVYAGLTDRDGDGTPRFNGTINFSEIRLLEPLKWRKPAVVFVGDMADLFHPNVADAMLDRIFAVMALRPDCLFLLLTKRPERMREYCSSRDGMGNAQICHAVNAIPAQLGNRHGALEMPLPNVWLGVTAEDQTTADERIPHLLATPAAKRFASVEPMLGPVDLTDIYYCIFLDSLRRTPLPDPDDPDDPNWPFLRYDALRGHLMRPDDIGLARLDWVICGGESGPGARPMHPDWARSLRDQCQAGALPFFFKQWGEYVGGTGDPSGFINLENGEQATGSRHTHAWGTRAVSHRVGKKRAGRLLDGREWNEVPTWP